MNTNTLAVPTMLHDFEIPDGNVVDTDALTLADRCDSCGAAALVRATSEFASSELLFCGSHAKRHIAKLISQDWNIDDQTYRIFPEFTGEVKRSVANTAAEALKPTSLNRPND